MSFSFMYGGGMSGNVNVNDYCDNNGPPPLPPMPGPMPGISYHHLPPVPTSIPPTSSGNVNLHAIGLHTETQGSTPRLSLPTPHDHQDLYKGNTNLHPVNQGLPLRLSLPPSTNQELNEGYQYQDPGIRHKPETENRPEKKPKKQRKRRPAGTAVSRIELKRRRNAGEEYVTRKGKVVRKKEYEPIECKCRLNCTNKVSHDVRSLIFKQFHGLADWNNQTQFIVSSVTVLDVKGRRKKAARSEDDSVPASSSGSSNNTDHRRTASRIFYLTNKKIRVCKPVFLSTLGITNKRLDYALRHKAVPMTALATPDMRGKKGPQNKTPQEVEDNIRTHIHSFPKPASVAPKSSKAPPSNATAELTISKMYSMYQEQCKAHGVTPASMWVYAKIYHSEFKLPPGAMPKKDTPCKTCERTRIILRSQENPEKIIQMLLKEHHEGMVQDMGGSYSGYS